MRINREAICFENAAVQIDYVRPTKLSHHAKRQNWSALMPPIPPHGTIA